MLGDQPRPQGGVPAEDVLAVSEGQAGLSLALCGDATSQLSRHLTWPDSTTSATRFAQYL